MTSTRPTFGPHGPFDPEEQQVLLDVVDAASDGGELLHAVAWQVERLEELGALIGRYPPLHSEQRLGRRTRDIESLVARLAGGGLTRFDLSVPTRALLARDLVLAEVNCYRLLRLVCEEAVEPPRRAPLLSAVDGKLCQCLYARLAEDVLRNIAADPATALPVARRAVLALALLWDRNRYRLQDYYPVLQATWDARRRVPATLGTLMGTAEMFGLIREGADPAFVEALTDAEQTPDMAAAFREFLFGTSTETLRELEQKLCGDGRAAISRTELAEGLLVDAAVPGADPATTLYAFFLTRHMQASARRLTGTPGPKRTAEEYVMLRHLELVAD